MASLQSLDTSDVKPNFDEQKWLIHIRRVLEEEYDNDYDNTPACIFNVPKLLMSTDPDSYIPHQVAIGPYHHGRPELYDMQRYKLAAVKRTQKKLQSIKFQQIVDHLMELDAKIRACYNKFIDFGHETLAWMMAIDVSFLLEFLRVYSAKEGKLMMDRDSVHYGVVRDVMMLENQIPLFVLRTVLEMQLMSSENADNFLFPTLIGFCNELSPFKIDDNSPEIQVYNSSHLLDYLYHTILPKVETSFETTDTDEDQSNVVQDKNESSTSKIVLKLKNGPVRLMKRVVLFLHPPWRFISNLPGFVVLRQPVAYFFFPQTHTKESNPETGNISGFLSSKPPLIEEITIPSVTELSKSGVQFLPTSGNITSINFDIKTGQFHLPTISLDENSQIILRNLVAHEALTTSGPLVLTRYTELMNGIIDTEEDVKLLREAGVIQNRLKSDGEVAELWNGMSRSIRITKVPFLDKVIEDVERYHNGRWKVKIGKFLKVYVFASWQILTLIAAIFLLFLLVFQVFLSIFSYARIFRVNGAN